MARSTGVVLSAGALSLADVVLTGWDPAVALKIAVGTTAAAFVSAGLDNVASGLGMGLGVLLLLAAVLKSGPRIANKLFPTTAHFGPK